MTRTAGAARGAAVFGMGAVGRLAAAGVFAVSAALAAGAASAHPYGGPHAHPHRSAPPKILAKGRRFILIGEKIVSDRFDRDAVALPGRERVFQIKLCVRGRAVEFFDLDVRFANGGKQDVPIRRVIPRGDCTRNITLRSAPRNVRRIVMKYTSVRKQGPQPVVQVFAR